MYSDIRDDITFFRIHTSIASLAGGNSKPKLFDHCTGSQRFNHFVVVGKNPLINIISSALFASDTFLFWLPSVHLNMAALGLRGECGLGLIFKSYTNSVSGYTLASKAHSFPCHIKHRRNSATTRILFPLGAILTDADQSQPKLHSHFQVLICMLCTFLT